MTTNNDATPTTQEALDNRARLLDRIDEILDKGDAAVQQPEHLTDSTVVNLLPQIMTTAETFHTWAQGDVRYRDLLAQVDDVIMGVRYFADDEFTAVAPSVIGQARDLLEESDCLGFVAMGRIMQLNFMIDHPELMQLAAKRARQQLYKALHHGTLPERK